MVEFDYKRINEIMESCTKYYPEKCENKFALWVMACDYWLKEEYTGEDKVITDDDEQKEEFIKMFEKCHQEFKNKKEYQCVNVENQEN